LFERGERDAISICGLLYSLRYCGQDSRIALSFTNICPFSFLFKIKQSLCTETLVNILFTVVQNLPNTKKSIYVFTCSEVGVRKLQMMKWNVKPAKMWFLLSFFL